jgi:DNA-binding NtrC family response regulator
MAKSKILVVDDEAIMRSSLTDWLKEDGYDVLAVGDGYTAIDQVKEDEWDLAVVDLKMPKMDGLEVLKQFHELKPRLPVIIVTAYATVDTAVMAMKAGAADYVVKPFNPEEISLIIKKLVEHQHLIKENVRLRRALTKRFNFHDLIGKSTKMLEVVEMIKTVAPTKSTVMINGESGTGKELVARAIHGLSPRKKQPFIAAACGAIPESLLSAELFGYEKGAFTGAVSQHKGRIEMADKGTLFLDEIGDISPQTQVDLLRFLQEREFRRIAGKALIRVDVRILVATNKNIDDMVARGAFREDLYYRLNVITITVPPLRERKEDIPLLAEHFLEKFTLETGKKVESISDETMKNLMEFNWPGNVRQFANTIEHAVVVAQGLEIQKNDLPQHVTSQPRRAEQPTSLESLTMLEKQHIRNVLKSCKWNIRKSAQILGINRVTLYNKIKKLKLKKE